MILSLKLLFYIETLQLLAFGMFYACLSAEARRVIRPMDLAIALAIPVVGLFGRDKAVFLVFIFAVPLLSIGRPGQLVGRYLLVLLLFPPLTGGFSIGSVYVGEVSAIQAFNLGALIALALTWTGRARPVVPIDCAVWMFFLVSLIAATRGLPLNGIMRWSVTTFLSVLPPFYIVARLVSTRRIAGDAALFFALGCFTNALVAIFEAFKRWPLYQSFYDSLHVAVLESATLAIRAGFLRAQGVVASPSVLGLVAALGLVVVLASRRRFRALAYWVIVIGFILALLACQSRGAWIAAAGGTMLYLVYAGRVGKLAIFAASAGVIGAGIVALTPRGSVVDQMIGRAGHAETTAEYRSNLLTRGLQEVANHPLTGQTRAQLEISMNDMRQGQHIIDFVNSHLSPALTAGLGGFALWLTAWIIPLIVGWGLRGRAAAHAGQSPVALPFAMIGMCFICLSFTSTIEHVPALVMLSMGLMSAFVRLAPTSGAPDKPLPARGRPALVARLPQSADPVDVSALAKVASR